MGLSELARRADVNPSYLSSLEGGKRNKGVTDRVLVRIAKALGVSTDELLGVNIAKLPTNTNSVPVQNVPIRGLLTSSGVQVPPHQLGNIPVMEHLIGESPHAMYALFNEDDSYIDLGIIKGQYVIIDPEVEKYIPGKLYLCIIEGKERICPYTSEVADSKILGAVKTWGGWFQ